MVEKTRFVLTELLEMGPLCSRYRGTLPKTASLREPNNPASQLSSESVAAEICLFRQGGTEPLSSAEEGNPIERWLRHLRLAKLLKHPSCRPILELDEEHVPPFVAFSESDGATLAEFIRDPAAVLRELGSIAVSCTQALMACEEIGLVVGGVSLENISRDRAGQWQVDVSSSCSPRFGVTDKQPLKSFVAPESLQSRQDVDFVEVADRATEVYSLAAMLFYVIDVCNLKSTPYAEKISNAFSDCLSTEPLARPTAKELHSRLQTDRLLDVTSDADAVSSDINFEATMNVDGDITIPVGYLAEGSQLGRYTVFEKLGEGGMGAVYRAQDAVNGKSVAIKILNKQVAPDSITARRFVKEARLLAKANNPYVVNLYEVNSDASFPYLVVEFVDGGTLGSLIKPGQPFDEQFALAVITDAVRGLAIAHSRSVVHRDFKPDNVLLTSDARAWMATHDPFADEKHTRSSPMIGKILAKVSDFGLARSAQQSESMAMTRDGALLGTPMYMSPEQCRGESAGLPSDVYSVGVTLFQLLAGRAPFDAPTQVGLLNQHCHAPPPSLKQLRPQISDALVRTIENCLAKTPEARYSDAGALLVDLENILRGEPTSLGLHPPILSLNDPQVLRFEHSWDLTASPSQLWPFVSNTDRVNHAIGLPAVTYTNRIDPIHGVQRFAEVKILGQQVRWQEHPYEWIEGRRLSVLREFTHGPFRWFVNVVELQPSVAGGTRIVKTLIVTPRNWVGKQLAKLQLGKKAKAGFGRTYRQIDDYIAQSQFNRADRDPFIGRTELQGPQRQKLHGRLEQLRQCKLDPHVVDTLGQFLEHASDLEVARVRPLALAERFQIDATQVVNACLEGTRLGIFSLLWDIMCPSCRIPADIQETLAAIKDHGFCESCNLNFGIDLAESVELIFRVHPEIRPVETATYCIGGPAWSRHVVAQMRLVAGERFACELSLSEGAYIVRGPQLPFIINFRVGHNNEVRRIELSLARPPADARIQLPVGSQVLNLCNDSASDQLVRIERSVDRGDALSAARATSMALFRELFPGEVLSSDQIVSVAHITVMRIKIHGAQQLYERLGDGPAFNQIRTTLEQVLRAVKENSGALVKTIGEGALASFVEPVDAVRTAVDLIDQLRSANVKLSIALHSGSAMVATLDERLDYFGLTLKSLEQLVECCPENSLQATTAITETPEVQSFIAERNLSVEVVTNLMLCDGCVAHRLQVNG